MARPRPVESPEPQADIAESRRQRLDEALATLVETSDDDGSAFLPREATVEPGSIVHELYEIWQAQVRGARRPEAHSLEKLQAWLKAEHDVLVPSLQHKLKGRLPIRLNEPLEREGVRALIAVMLAHWDAAGEGAAETAVPHPVVTGRDAAGISQIARLIVDRLSAPIYGVARDTLTISRSPGINTAVFMQEQADAEVVLIPVVDGAMHGPDPTSALAGTRLSLSRCLGQDARARVAWILRPEAQRDTLAYVNYLYERSFAVTLFRLLRVASENNWPGGLADWESLSKRLFVCVAPDPRRADTIQGGLVVDDFIPRRAPHHWRVGQQNVGFEAFGFVVTRRGADPGALEYWLHTKAEVPAFMRLEAKVEPTMAEAHRLLTSAVMGKASGKHSESVVALEKSGWRIVSATQFIEGKDLELPHSK